MCALYTASGMSSREVLQTGLHLFACMHARIKKGASMVLRGHFLNFHCHDKFLLDNLPSTNHSVALLPQLHAYDEGYCVRYVGEV